MGKESIKKVIVIGGGPAGLMAADVLSGAGVQVNLYDAMPSIGRKFLLAGKGGLNLTHSEPLDVFASRYASRRPQIEPWLQAFGPAQVRDWAGSLGVETFVGTSGRVFPTSMKAAPLLRAWLHRMRHPVQESMAGGAADASLSSVQFHMRHRWTGWHSGDMPSPRLCFDTPQGQVLAQADAVVLALGGGSWGRLGSDGAWVPWLQARAVPVAPLMPSNCGFDVQGGWSAHFGDRFVGQPFKSVAINFTTAQGSSFQRKGEFVATATGVEGSLIYAASSMLRDEILRQGQAVFFLDLLPDMPLEKVLAQVSHPRGSRSLSSHLKSRLKIDGIKMAVLHELLGKDQVHDPAQLATAIKHLPITLVAARPLDEAISTAGGVQFDGMDQNLMLNVLPGVFCAGEMLDWEAPTGGYLLTACLASGRAAAMGVLRWLKIPPPRKV